MNRLFDLVPELNAGDPLELVICGVKTVFRYCPPGTFLTGSPEGEKGRSCYETQRKVSLTRGFLLQETPVTQRLWTAVANGNTREFFKALEYVKYAPNFRYVRMDRGFNPSRFKGADRPVENVCYQWARMFAWHLNRMGFPPEGFRFELPSAEEWEYACRAGTTTRYNVGDELTDDDANFGKKLGETAPVKSYPPNAWGFYDMHGNVKEWCGDRDFHCQPPSRYVVRGGGWNDEVWNCRSSSWNAREESVESFAIGFRLALKTVEPSRSSFPQNFLRKLRF